MGGAYSTMGDRRGVNRILVGKPEGKRPLGKHRHKWEDGFSGSVLLGHGLERAGLG